MSMRISWNYAKHVKFSSIVIALLMVSIYFLQCSPKQKIYRIGILCGLDFFENTIEGFKEKMNDLNYVEGKNVVYDIRHSKSDMRIAKQFLEKFVEDKVDLIFVFPTDVAVAAKNLTRNSGIPVLFANANIEGVDLIKSVKEPGENITGVRYPGPDLTVKRFEILYEISPNIKKVWVPYKRGLAIVPSQLESLRKAAKTVDVALIEQPVDNAEEIKQIISNFEKNKSKLFDAILMIAEPLVVTANTFRIIGKYATEHKIPLGGALMSIDGYASIFGVSTDNVAVGKQAAPIADKIFKGIKPGTIPVISAENFLQFNYIAAKKIGIIIPEGLLKEANTNIL